MTEYNKICEGYFTSTGVARFLSLPMVPDQIEIWNKTKWATATDNLVRYATGFQEDAAGTAYAITADGAAAGDKNVTLTTGGFTFLSAGTYQYGSTFTITGIVAATGVVTTSASHGYSVGDTVLLYGTTGMLQIAGTMTTITAVPSPTTFTIGNIPTSGFSNATAGFVKRVLYPDLYVPFNNPITNIQTSNAAGTPGAGTSTLITTAVNHSFVLGQEVFFVIPQTGFVNTTSVWGMGPLDSQFVINSTGVPQQAYITTIVSANSFVVNVNSTGFPAFTYPTSAQAALGITFPQVMAIGDQNAGFFGIYPLPVQPTQQTYTNTLYPRAITIPGAFLPNTRQGVIVGIGNGTQLMHQTGDVVRWRAIYPDQIQTS